MKAFSKILKFLKTVWRYIQYCTIVIPIYKNLVNRKIDTREAEIFNRISKLLSENEILNMHDLMSIYEAVYDDDKRYLKEDL